MKQFYDIYKDNEKLSSVARELENKKLPPLVAELSWSHNVAIFSRCKREEEREFYIKLCIKKRLSKRELERQIDTSSFERNEGLSPA